MIEFLTGLLLGIGLGLILPIIFNRHTGGLPKYTPPPPPPKEK